MSQDTNEILSGLIFDIQRYSIHDGPGIRTTVFLKGCPLRCLWCQNPESIRKERDILFDQEKCTECGMCEKVCKEDAINLENEKRVNRERCTYCGECADNCYAKALRMAGELMTVDEVLEEVKKDLAFYKKSSGGMTLSGGEPMMHPTFSGAILNKCQSTGIHTCIETSGFAPWDSFEEVLPHTDLILYDLKVMNPEKHEEFIGASNDLILNNAELLIEEDIDLEFRMPLIPSYNSNNENIEKLSKFLNELGREQIHILPYHDLAVTKYRQLGKDYPLSDLDRPSENLLEKTKKKFEDNGISVRIER